MTILSTIFKFAAMACVVLVVVGLGWLIYGERGVSQASQLGESMEMVHHQTAQVGVAVSDTGQLMEVDISGITDISNLMAEWTPRYDAARSAFHKFDLAIKAAEERAAVYFQSQRELTARIHDDDRRARAEAMDDVHYQQFEQWQSLAGEVRAQAQSVILRLDDMDIELKKLELLSGMSFDAMGFKEVPGEILDLDRELEQFRAASEGIRDMTESPFATAP